MVVKEARDCCKIHCRDRIYSSNKSRYMAEWIMRDLPMKQKDSTEIIMTIKLLLQFQMIPYSMGRQSISKSSCIS